MNDPKTDPCLAERKASYKCLHRNNFDRDACLSFFHVYKDCKNAANLARRKGVPFVKNTEAKDGHDSVGLADPNNKHILH